MGKKEIQLAVLAILVESGLLEPEPDSVGGALVEREVSASVVRLLTCLGHRKLGISVFLRGLRRGSHYTA